MSYHSNVEIFNKVKTFLFANGLLTQVVIKLRQYILCIEGKVFITLLWEGCVKKLLTAIVSQYNTIK